MKIIIKFAKDSTAEDAQKVISLLKMVNGIDDVILDRELEKLSETADEKGIVRARAFCKPSNFTKERKYGKNM